MGNWFDERAKSSARRISTEPSVVPPESDAASGLSRRDVLKRGGIVAGVAWTAPVLMSVMTPAVAQSPCPDERPPCDGVCCVPEDNCVDQGDGTFDCVPPGGIGGDCLNSGQGVSGCTQDANSSIHCNGDRNNNICGGPGAQCEEDAECLPTLTCSGPPRGSLLTCA